LEDRIDTTGNGDVGDGRCTIGVGLENECPLTAHLPDTFSGTDPDKLKAFLFQCQLYFRSNLNHISREWVKVDFTMTFLTDIALSWFESAIDQEDAGVIFPWSTNLTLFTAKLCLHFSISDPKGELLK
jgi:hypothetical protein